MAYSLATPLNGTKLSQPAFEQTGLPNKYLCPVIKMCVYGVLKNSATGLDGGYHFDHYKVQHSRTDHHWRF